MSNEQEIKTNPNLKTIIETPMDNAPILQRVLEEPDYLKASKLVEDDLELDIESYEEKFNVTWHLGRLVMKEWKRFASMNDPAKLVKDELAPRSDILIQDTGDSKNFVNYATIMQLVIGARRLLYLLRDITENDPRDYGIKVYATSIVNSGIPWFRQYWKQQQPVPVYENGGDHSTLDRSDAELVIALFTFDLETHNQAMRDIDVLCRRDGSHENYPSAGRLKEAFDAMIPVATGVWTALPLYIAYTTAIIDCNLPRSLAAAWYYIMRANGTNNMVVRARCDALQSYIAEYLQYLQQAYDLRKLINNTQT